MKEETREKEKEESENNGGLKGRCKIDLPKLVEFSKNREKKREP